MKKTGWKAGQYNEDLFQVQQQKQQQRAKKDSNAKEKKVKTEWPFHLKVRSFSEIKMSKCMK